MSSHGANAVDQETDGEGWMRIGLSVEETKEIYEWALFVCVADLFGHTTFVVLSGVGNGDSLFDNGSCQGRRRPPG